MFPRPNSSNGSGPSSSAGQPSTMSFGTEADRLKMEAFRKVKPTCVSLMGTAGQTPTSNSPHAGLIDTLTCTLSTLPTQAMTPSMINYVLFPITQILRHHDPLEMPDLFLEATFRLLSLVVTAWKTQPGGIDISAWEQLWRLTTASIGPRVVAPGSGKGKGKEVGQQVQLQAIRLLTALLEPSASHPSPAMLDKVSTPKSPLMPTLFQTITLLLALISPTPPNGQLQLASLELLRPLIGSYLRGQSSVLASVLPGTVSAVAKLFSVHGSTIKSDAAASAAGVVEDAVVETLSDVGLRKFGILRSGIDDLEQLAEEWEEESSDRHPSSSPSASGEKDPFPPLTKSYLEFTSSQLLTAIRPILSTLSSHPSNVAREAAVSLAFGLLSRCNQSLPGLVPHELSTLLTLSRDDFDPVRHTALKKLGQLLGQEDLQLDTTLIELLSEAINALPRLIISHQEQRVINASNLIAAIADTTATLQTANPISDLLGPRGRVERWGWALLHCLEFGRPAGWSTMDNAAARSAEKGWATGLIANEVPLLIEGGDKSAAQPFPSLPFRYLESESTIKAVSTCLTALGSAGGESALHSVNYFVQLAHANRSHDPSKAVPALWLAGRLLDGIATGQEEGAEGKIGKATRKMARDVTRIVISIDNAEDEDEFELEEEIEEKKEEQETGLVPVERSRGLDAITTLLDRPAKPDSHTAHETRKLHAQAQRMLLSALTLSTLSLTSRVLSSSFRPLLLNALYELLAHLASPYNLVSTYAEIALGHVAYNAGYASVQNLILDNVDYVINVVSQRLTPSRLSPTAPVVLITMIRLTRSEIVPMVHDIVDEIFDALDDYHGYEVLASGLLAVLVTLVDVMADDVASQGLSEERKKKLADLDRTGKAPNPEADFGKFTKWLEERQQHRSKEVESILERAPQHAWGKERAKENEPKEGEDNDGDGDVAMDDAEVPMTRSQEITTLILDKSLNFLSHRSPFLRARILALISRAIPVLASGNREGDLLPLIDRAWNIIILRLDDPVPYVVTEAAEVIARLCEHTGDFMSRRILDSAWPKLKSIMEKQKVVDSKSALARKGALGSDANWTVSHRLYLAILSVASFVASKVPVGDDVLWDIMVASRPFLDTRAHEEVQQRAVELYNALGMRDADALWVVLQSTLGQLGGVWAYLSKDDIRLGPNARQFLQAI